MPVPAESPAYRDLSDWVVTKILEAMKNGSIKPGERLVERDVAERFSVSRAPVRDAMHKLERLGVVVRKPPRATYVRSWTDQDVAEVLLISDALILLSVQLAVPRLAPDDITELERVVEETRSAVRAGSSDVAEQVALDMEFHLTIAKASRNARLAELIETLWLPLVICMKDYLAEVGRVFSLRQHEELLEVFRLGDVRQAEALTRSHAQESQQAILKALEQPFHQEAVETGSLQTVRIADGTKEPV